MSNTKVLEIDGRNLYYTFLAGARKIIEHQVEINKINVFPVKDGDTGTNLASTIRSVVENIKPNRSYKKTADTIAEAALMGARGNSGIIFAQFLYGLSIETKNAQRITIKEFAESLNNSVKYVYQAVANPVEGTILTVIKDWATHIYQNSDTIHDFNQLIISSLDKLKTSLEETKSKLEVLKKNNVVDAGAKGFVLFVEGVIELIRSQNIRSLLKIQAETATFEIDEVVPEEVTFRYCTEAVIKGKNIEKKKLNNILSGYGDSIVIAGSDKFRRIHVHTNTPADLFSELKDLGNITYQKADDMVRQSEAVYNRKWKIALVTDSTCDLSEDLIEKYQINMVPLNITFGENHYIDKVTMKAEQFYPMLESSSVFPKTSQVNEKTFTNLYSHLASHYDSVIAIHLTEKFSGTYFSSKKAAEKISKEFGKKISVIDSKNLSGALGLLTLRIANEIEKGNKHDSIVNQTNKWIEDAKIFVSVRDLKYMVKGGRVSKAKGLIAKLLNVNPIVSMDENGKSLIFGKTHSQKANMKKVMNHVKNISEGKKIWNYIVLHANNADSARWYIDKMKEFTGKEPISVVNISPVIVMNAGLGTVATSLLFE